MLRNVSYKNSKIKDEINTAVGFPFSFFERIKMNGIGSKNLRIKSCSEEIKSILNLDNNDNKCNIEIRRQGIIVFFKEEYGFELKAAPEGKYDAIIVAVNHKEYAEMSEDQFQALAAENAIFVDLIGIFRGKINRFKYWSL